MILFKLVKQDLKNLVTTPVVCTACIIYPWILVGLFGFMFSSLYGNSGVSSYDYYGVTMIMYLILASLTITPNAFMEKRLRAGNIRIAYSPISKMTVYMSKIISSYIFLLVTFSINIAIMNFSGLVNFGGKNFIYVLILIWASLAFVVTLGGAVCVILKSEEFTDMILSNVANILALVSGIFFPVDSLGSTISSLTDLSPVKWVLNLIFNIIYDGNFSHYISVIFGLIIISIISLVIMHINYKPEDYI